MAIDPKRKTTNTTLGRGQLLFKESGSTTYRPLGNTPQFNLTASSETLKHYNSDSGVKVQDKEVVVQTDYSGSFTTDNVNHKNLAALFLGSTSTVSVSSATGEEESFTGVKQGDKIKLASRKVASVVVEVASVAKTLTTDYTVDAERGIITIVAGGGIADGATVDVTYNITAHSYDRTISAGEAVEGSLMFIANNPEGDDIDFEIPDAKLSPNGEFAIKAEEWQTLPFSIAIGVPDDGSPAITMNGQPYTP